jgi:hypothetical protein
VRGLFRTLARELLLALAILTVATAAFILLSLIVHGNVRWA